MKLFNKLYHSEAYQHNFHTILIYNRSIEKSMFFIARKKNAKIWTIEHNPKPLMMKKEVNEQILHDVR